MAQFYSAKRRVTTRQIITVTVNDLDPFGQGVARHQGKALFVSGVLPHEQAEVVLVEDKKQYARAEVKRRLTDSPQRQAPRCPHFGVCGGCQQQHASVPLQQQSKRAALGRLMKREVDDVIAGAPWGYRRRARLSLNYQPKTQQLQMGFRQANAKAIVDVVQCPVLVPQLEALLPAVRECLSALSALRHLGHVELVQAHGYNALLPILSMAGVGQVGAAIAVLMKTRNARLKKMIKGALPVGLLGIGEPLIFGVTLPLGKPFLAACLGGAVGGALISYWKVATVITFGLSGLPLALTIVTGKVVLYLLGYLVAVIAGFLFTWLLGFNDPEE